jgi:putative ABC transport system ATP-binding protein
VSDAAVSAAPSQDTAAVPVVEVLDVTRSYAPGGRRARDADPAATVHALRGVSFRIQTGELLSIVGPSGSGKSTLLHLLGALDRPTTGSVRFAGRDVRDLSDAELAVLRNREIGFVFQQFQLLPRTSALANVALPLVYRGLGRAERRQRSAAALEAVGLSHRLEHRPAQLSGGEQQRVAIARALVGEPTLLLADEPTGNLDSRTGAEIIGMLRTLNRERGVAVVVITHDREVAAQAPRQLRIRDGLLDDDGGGR